MIPDYAHVLGRFQAVRPGKRPGLWNCRCPVADRHRNGDRNPSARLWVDEPTGRLCFWCAKGCKWREAVAATDTRPADWYPPKDRRQVFDQTPGRRSRRGFPVGAKIAAAFDYTDESGELLYQVVRTDPKGFWQRRPVPGHAGQWAYSLSAGKYTYSQADGYWAQVIVNDPKPPVVELGEVRRVLYRLPELVDPKRRAQPVLIAEGEGKVDLLRSLGFLATCNAGGAGKWSFGLGSPLTGRRVVILPDMDDVGVNHAYQVAASCLGCGVASLRVVNHGMGWENLPVKADVKDWLWEVARECGDTGQALIAKQRQALIDLIRLQREWKPAECAA